MSTIILKSNKKQKQSVIVESQVINKKMILKDKLNLCAKNTLKQKSSKISAQELISKGKGCFPFWNPQLMEISSKLWLPIETGLPDSELISSNGLLKEETAENSWFSSKLIYPQNKSLLQTCLQSSMYSHAGCTDLEVIKTKLLRISPTKEQKKTFKEWTDCSRYVFNRTISYIRTCVNWTPTWMDIKKDMLGQLPV